MSAQEFEEFAPKIMTTMPGYDSKTGERHWTECEPYTITVEQAFAFVVQNAAYEYGHSGYTGSVAEKDDFEMLDDKPIDKNDAQEIIGGWMTSQTNSDKWGPAKCLEVKADENGDGAGWWFFGYASS